MSLDKKKNEVEEFLKKIKKEMENRKAETNLICLDVKADCIKYGLNDGGNDWGKDKCYYVFYPQTECVEIAFRYENKIDSAKRKDFASSVEKDESLASMSCTWQNTPHCAIKYAKIPYDYDNLEKTAKDAVEKMIEFEKNYGDKILGYIKKSKNSSNVESVPSITKENTMAENPYVKLLLNNHNIILHGAPGTGKTYLAKEIAKDLIFNAEDRALINKKESEVATEDKERFDALKKQFNEQCGFVQFHQSYDYTDFVEGLRPVKKEGSTDIVFELKDGVFKQFCQKALTAQKINSVDNFEETFQKLIEKFNDEENIEIPSLGGKKFALSLNASGNGFVLMLKNSEGVYEQTSYGFFNYDQCYKVYRDLPGVPTRSLDNYRKAIVKYMKDNLDLKKYIPGTTTSDIKPYVFIIDEINRGEMSKIFGELFFSIDPGYRGKEGKIRTQYANLQDGANEFDTALGIADKNFGHFFVPENVYIIGTMNDIDRSVESMDFAMRRRFAFKEITASERSDMLKELGSSYDEADKRMTRLNSAIEKIPGLSSAYHIGPAYFLKLNNYNGNFEQLWTNHIEGLLREYLRGMDKVEEKVHSLKAAFDLKE
ncbi:AAA family ATPase [Fibrobacter sp.]|uniref:McrB family protein n=1 Tax=Fibrobacter sp. TaxID=35828 RepID=UPI0025C30B43|nr:AAA family ATPase [Fibrobacter sp.]MBR3070623.1 AAA family ATPase [Fibrobacter sp.]